MKKILTIFLTVCLIASALCISTFAADQPTGNVIRVSGLKSDGKLIRILEDSDFEHGWNRAMVYASNFEFLKAEQYDRIVVDLLADWNANQKGEFGSGEGFDWSTIYVPKKAIVTINMNGHTINRGLGNNNELDGEVICIEQNADVIINGGKAGDPIARPDLASADVQFGTITGGNSDNGAGGIHIRSNANVTLNNVIIKNNIADDDDGAGIAMYDGVTLVMNGGGFVDNKNHSVVEGFGAAIYVYESTAKFENVLFQNNQFTYSAGLGAVIDAYFGVVTMDECMVIGNGTKSDTAGTKGARSTIVGTKSNFDIRNTTFTGNGSARKIDRGHGQWSLIHISDSTLYIDTCTFHNNLAGGYGIESDGPSSSADVSVVNSSFTDNAFCVWSGASASFTNCTFNKNKTTDHTFFISSTSARAKLTFTDCDMGDSTISESEQSQRVSFVDTDAVNGDLLGSIFGDGSLIMIVALLALVTSVVSIGISIYYNKKKALPAASSTDKE